MTATVLVSGKLARDPEQKTSRNGNPFATATIRDGFGDDALWWRVFAFSDEAREELMSLQAGDGVAVSGSFKAEVYAGAGEPRVSLSVTADRLISAHQRKKERAADKRAQVKEDRAGGRRAGRPDAQQDGLLEHAAARPYDDPIPF